MFVTAQGQGGAGEPGVQPEQQDLQAGGRADGISEENYRGICYF